MEIRRFLPGDYVIPSKRERKKRPIPIWKVYPELRGFVEEMLLDGMEPKILMKHLIHLGMTKNVTYSWKKRLLKEQPRHQEMLKKLSRDPEMIKKRGQFLTGLMSAKKEWRLLEGDERSTP